MTPERSSGPNRQCSASHSRGAGIGAGPRPCHGKEPRVLMIVNSAHMRRRTSAARVPMGLRASYHAHRNCGAALAGAGPSATFLHRP